MRVLVIGGTKFIGPHVVGRLVDLGHKVALFHRGQTQAELPPSVEQILGDRHELGSHVADFRRFGPEVVVDMIAFTEADALGLVQTFRGLARHLVVISSADVYRAYGRFLGTEHGPIEPTPLPDDAPLRTILYPYRAQAEGPADFNYSYDKIPVEQAALGHPDLPATILRLPIVHGPGDPYRRLSPYLRRMDAGRPAIVLDETMASWKCPRGYVENVAAAIALAAVNNQATGRVYNIAEAPSDTEAEWVRKIGQAAGWQGKIVTAPAGRIPIPYCIQQSLDTVSSRIRRELKYAETVDPREAIERTIAWERANPQENAQSIGLLPDEAEDALLRESGPVP